jgi:hypothetical protein
MNVSTNARRFGAGFAAPGDSPRSRGRGAIVAPVALAVGGAMLVAGVIAAWAGPSASPQRFPHLAGVVPSSGLSGGGVAGPAVLALGVASLAAALWIMARRELTAGAVVIAAVLALAVGALALRESLRRLAFADAMLPADSALGPGPGLVAAGLADDLGPGLDAARASIDEGRATAALDTLVALSNAG